MDEKVMESWDKWRKYISEGGTASWPRDDFENLIDWYEGRIKKLEEVDTRHGVRLVDRLEKAEARAKELEDGIEKHCRDNKISSLEYDGTYSTAKCRGWNELYKLIEKK